MLNIVTPYRQQKPQSEIHQNLGKFDWVDAIKMMQSSVLRSNNCLPIVLTDGKTTPSLEKQGLNCATFLVKEKYLMLWILKVSASYLKSPLFCNDTVLISPDILVFENLSKYFKPDIFDIGVMWRFNDKFVDRPLLNSVQFWPIKTKDRLIKIYEKAISIAEKLPENELLWGADTTPFVQMFRNCKLDLGVDRPAVMFYDAEEHLRAASTKMISVATEGGKLKTPTRFIDFKYDRKRHMRAVYDAILKGLINETH